MPLFSPAVSRRRSTPSFSIVPVKPKPSISTPIDAHEAGLVDVDLVGRHGDVVGARGADLLDHRIDLLLVQRLQAADLVVDDAGLHRAAAGRVDAQHHGLRAGVLEGAASARPPGSRRWLRRRRRSRRAPRPARCAARDGAERAHALRQRQHHDDQRTAASQARRKKTRQRRSLRRSRRKSRATCSSVGLQHRRACRGGRGGAALTAAARCRTRAPRRPGSVGSSGVLMGCFRPRRRVSRQRQAGCRGKDTNTPGRRAPRPR